MYQQAKEMEKKREIEDAKNQAADIAVNRVIQRDGNFEKILEDIKNAAFRQKKDIFTKKIGLFACNEFYDDKAGLPNIP